MFPNITESHSVFLEIWNQISIFFIINLQVFQIQPSIDGFKVTHAVISFSENSFFSIPSSAINLSAAYKSGGDIFSAHTAQKNAVNEQCKCSYEYSKRQLMLQGALIMTRRALRIISF